MRVNKARNARTFGNFVQERASLVTRRTDGTLQ